ncbi:MAG: hypothetical protein EA406_04955 [Rhodospirillales bacterium]|nr:MAG: hypothetical protein EA406_04955 [Rhodospirillales bacterium]
MSTVRLVLRGDEPLAIEIDPAAQPLLVVQQQPDAQTVYSLTAPSVRAILTGEPLELLGLEMEGAGVDPSAAQVRIRRLTVPSLAGWIPPLQLEAGLSRQQSDIAVSGTLSALDGRISGRIDGTADIAADTGRVEVSVRPIRFQPRTLQPVDIAPALAAETDLAQVTGQLGGTVTLRWQDGPPSTVFRVTARDLGFIVAGVRVQGLAGSVSLDRLVPIRTPPGQRLTVALIDPGMPATNGAVRFRFDAAGRLRVDHAEIEISGGRLSLHNVVIDPRSPRHDIVIFADGLDLAEVLERADVPGASARGRISGTIPVSLSADGVIIADASLTTDAPGLLRYRPAAPTPALPSDDPRIRLLKGALEDFRYDTLSVSLDGRTGAAWQSRLRISGRNPDFLEGQPFILNVNIEVVPGASVLELGDARFAVGDALPIYNALFGVRFLEWLGNTITALRPAAR